MSDAALVANHIGSLSANERIGDGAARTIASWFQSSSPHSRGLAALSTSGAILDTTESEIDRELAALPFGNPAIDDVADRTALANLRHYVKSIGPRGSVAGWANLWIR